MILIARHKETSIPQPSENLIQNLLATNLCVVLVAYWTSILQGRWKIYAQVIGPKISLFLSWYDIDRQKREQTFSIVGGT